MSHRKFERPRHGNLAFANKKRTKWHFGKIKSFPRDDETKKPHFTAFMTYKAGSTHIVRDMDRPGSKMHKKEVAEHVTVLEAPPMKVVGLVGYVETPHGPRSLTSVWAGHISDACKRRFYKRWYRCKKKHYTKYQARYAEAQAAGGVPMQAELDRIKKYCQRVRAICHTQMDKIGIKMKKAHIKEIQINGGSVAEKVDFAHSLFERDVKLEDVFTKDENCDTIGVTKGKGFKGVVNRWGVTKLARKSHRGLRKVACIGAWHPARVSFQVPRAGNKGYFHRIHRNKKIYKIGKNIREDPFNAMTENDITEKAITPMGGFVNYGVVKEDFAIVKGAIQGPPKRIITLRKPIKPSTKRRALETSELKFIDTASKLGTGRFQTAAEKEKFYASTRQMRRRFAAREEKAAAEAAALAAA